MENQHWPAVNERKLNHAYLAWAGFVSTNNRWVKQEASAGRVGRRPYRDQAGHARNPARWSRSASHSTDARWPRELTQDLFALTIASFSTMWTLAWRMDGRYLAEDRAVKGETYIRRRRKARATSSGLPQHRNWKGWPASISSSGGRRNRRRNPTTRQWQGSSGR